MTTEVHLLGPLRITVDGVEADLTGQKLRGILAVLALRAGQPVRRDELIEELRLSRTSDSSNSLHAHIARLRRWLRARSADPGILTSVGSSYRLDLDRHAVDAHLFEDRVEHALEISDDEPRRASTLLTEALALWRGDALADLDGGPFVTDRAAQLRRLRATAREVLTSLWVEAHQDRRVIVYARRFLDDDPLNERLWESLIVALRRSNRPAQAYRAFREADELYRAELGIPLASSVREALSGPLSPPLAAGL
ncbi:AfsR/SARP family transcriptional regulator [Nocardia panacis]|uniref:AfsR/SARP family transcriptional regulator n=1 Tax=Nocardia panacis TaxID=2340916 RepID=UPI0011C34753|nr:BTAD domain-containing putative transcriptional regulator [Nocardia panacis]